MKKIKKEAKKRMANKPDEEISQTKCSYGCIYFEKKITTFSEAMAIE